MFKYSKEDLALAASKSENLGQMIEFLSGSKSGAQYKTMRKYIEMWNIDTSHFNSYSRHKVRSKTIAIPIEDILVENYKGGIKNQSIKNRLLSLGVIVDECVLCQQKPFWNGAILVLQLDHINGNSKDNRLSNLRLLCPNCHTQTKTWGNKKRIILS